MRVKGLVIVAALAVPFAVALAEEEGHHEGGATAEHHGEEACTAASSEEECAEFWEHHINWFSFDYKAGPSQAREHRRMPAPFGFALVNFVVFAGIMYRLAAKPLREFVATRHLTIRKDLDEAAAMRRDADEKLRQSNAKLEAVDAEMDALVAKLRADAESEKARLVAAAEVEAERIRKDAQTQIATEMGRLRRELKREVVDLAMATATKLLVEGVKPADQHKLAERYLASLEAPAASTTTRSS